MLIETIESQVVFIDLQEKLIPALHDNQSVLANARVIAEVAKLLDVPVWGTEQNPNQLGATPDYLQKLYQKTLAKMQFSAVEEGLAEWLRPPHNGKLPAGNARSMPKHLQKNQQNENTRDSIIIAGCEAHICVLQTALNLVEEDFHVWVVTDACASRTERNRDAAFDRLAGAGVELVTTEMVIYEWLRTAEHPSFKAILEKVK